MSGLDAPGRRLLAYLVANLKSVVPGNPSTYVSYRRIHVDLGLSLLGPTYGSSLQNQGLNSLAAWTASEGLPAITGIVVAENSFEPGAGYFKLLGNPVDAYKRWESEITKAKETDWSLYLGGEEEISAEPALGRTSKLSPLPAAPGRRALAPGTASVWRLVSYHEEADADRIADEMVRRGVIAIGWSDVGDLEKAVPQSSEAIGSCIREAYPTLQNSHTGGPSLWNFWRNMMPGDLVIIVARSRRKHVVEVTGDYCYSVEGIGGYCHLRSAALTPLNGDELWEASGGKAADGESMFWTLTRLSTGGAAASLAYEEGARFELRLTAIERNPRARKDCIDHFGAACYVCKFDFSSRYGELGEGYIHVHHRHDIALTGGAHTVDPINDLVPLCPNCHAMVHRQKPAADVEDFKRKYWA